MAQGDGVVSFVIGLVLTLVGVASLVIDRMPVIFCGFLLFGPLALIHGLREMTRAPRPPPYPAYAPYPPPYPAPYPQYPPPFQPPYTPRPPPAAPMSGIGCMQCGAPLPPHSAACPNCGLPAPGARPCPTCGALLPGASVFCHRCGTRLA